MNVVPELFTLHALLGNVATITSEVLDWFLGAAVPTFFAGRVATLALGSIGIALVTLMTVPLISGAGYRVTIPVVIQVAVMRQEYEQSKR